jgi:ribonuclease VapC
MVLDSSAVVAILMDEPEAKGFLATIAADGRRLISTATVIEISMVMSGRKTEGAIERVDRFLDDIDVKIVPLDIAQMRAARRAFLRYGKGRHEAGLNFGDCISYALAKTTGEALLFKGTDFAKTDIKLAVSAS